MPLLRLGRVVRDAHAADIDRLTVYLSTSDPKTPVDLPAYCREQGLALAAVENNAGILRFTIIYCRRRYLEAQYLEPVPSFP